MTTQTKLSNPSEIAQEPMVKPYFSQVLVAITSLIIGLILGIFVTNLTTTATEMGLQPVAERAAPTYSRGPTLAEYTAAIEENKASEQRAIEAETARYTSLGLFYAAGNEADVQRAIEAEAARYSAMAKFYLTEDEANIQRAIEAETARYNGLADFYGAEAGANSLAWPPRPTQFHIAEPVAENALASYHQSEWGRSPNVTLPIAENALAEYHQSEWGRTPNVALPAAENDLTAYHQSEWGRTLSTVLPIAESGVDANQDIGLMEFSTAVNEAGMPQHDREYGLAAVSTISNETSPQPVIEADADQDIGLMEFLAVPNETSSQHLKAGTLPELHNK